MSAPWLLPQAPASSTREGRVRLIGEAAEALLSGEMPSREAALFVGGALLAYLRNGGDLLRDYFQIIKPSSRRTPSVIWTESQADANGASSEEDQPHEEQDDENQ